mgnify:FL=1
MMNEIGITDRGVFNLQMSTLLLWEYYRLSVKNLRFFRQIIWFEDKYVCLDEKYYNFRVIEHTIF